MSNKTEKKIKDFPYNKENPFMPNLLVPKKNSSIAITKKAPKALLDVETGEIDDTLFLAQRKEVDRDEFVKVFQSHIHALFNLSKPAQKIFAYIMSITEFHDRIIFELDDCKQYTGYTSNEAIYKGLIELLDNEIIARATASNIYFINPQIFYKGDRMVLITEYRRRITDSTSKSIKAVNQIDLFENQASGKGNAYIEETKEKIDSLFESKEMKKPFSKSKRK